jgi:hypothetical protein
MRPKVSHRPSPGCPRVHSDANADDHCDRGENVQCHADTDCHRDDVAKH